MDSLTIEPVSENSLLIHTSQQISASQITITSCFVEQVRQQLGAVILDIIPSYTTILVVYRLTQISEARLITELSHIYQNLDISLTTLGRKLIELPAFYHPNVAPDLLSLAAEKQLSTDEIIKLHSEKNYLVYAIGFSPGFAFLAEVDAQIATPRHPTPRPKVRAGSIGIADKQTAVYPNDSPGGWQIIGNCPIPLYQPNNDPITPFDIGDRVTFVPITQTEFIALGGQL